MSTRKVLLIFLALVVIISGVLLIRKSKNNKVILNLPEATPSIERLIKEKFQGLTIPDDSEKIELENVSGGEGIGIATRSQVIADLPSLQKGEKYQVFLGNGSKTILLGNLRELKGGYILEYDSSKYLGYNQIIIMRGSQHILEGSF